MTTPSDTSSAEPKMGLLARSWRSWLPFALLFVAALAIRLAFLRQVRDYPLFFIPIGDAEGYDLWAQKIASGDALGRSVFYQAPLYPYFLGFIYSIFGRDLVVVRLFQAVMDSASCVLFALAGNRFFSRPSGLVAGILMALYPMNLFFVLIMQKAALTVFCLGLFLFFLGEALYGKKPRLYWLASGAALGLFCLVRENALAFAPVLAAWLLTSEKLRKPAWIKTAIFLAGLFSVLFPVAMRNFIVGDTFALTTSQFGANFYYGNNREAAGLYEPLKWGRSSWRFEQDDARELAEKALGRGLSPSEISRYWTKKAFEEIAQNPGDWFFRTVKKWFLLWNRVEVADSEDTDTVGLFSGLLHFLNRAFPFAALAPLAAFGLALSFADIRRHGIILLLLMTYALSVTAFFIFDRYRLPLASFLCLYAGAGLTEGLRLFRQKRAKALIRALGIGFAAYLAVRIPVVPKEIMTANSAYNMGVILEEKKKDLAGSIKWYEKAVADNPGHVKANMALAVWFLRQGDASSAADRLYTAIKFKPGFADAHRLLARIMTKAQKADASTAHYLALLEQEPGNTEALTALREQMEKDAGLGRIRALAARAFLDPKNYPAAEYSILYPAEGVASEKAEKTGP